MNQDRFVLKSINGWVLYEPGVTEEQIVNNDPPFLLRGAGDFPTKKDFLLAKSLWKRRERVRRVLQLKSKGERK